jgi:hypothetical protein
MSILPTAPVFISYSRKDNDVTRRIVRFLQREGIKIWLDNEKLIPGTAIWEEEIETAIKVASAVIAVMSPDSKNSEWVRREISLADQHRKQIFPLLVRGDEDSAITLRLITRQYVDLRQHEEEGLTLLGTTLLGYLEQQKIEEGDTEGSHAIGAVRKVSEQKSATTSHMTELHKPSWETATNKITSSPQWNSVLWGTVGWAIAGAIAGYIYWSGGDYSIMIGGAFGGAIGGLVTAITLYVEHMLSDRKSILWVTLAWAVGAAIGWTIGNTLTEAVGAAIGGAIAVAIGLAITLRVGHISFDWKRLGWITLAWAIGWAIGWIISRYFQVNLNQGALGWTIGIAVAATLSGFVTLWQLLQMKQP